MTGNNNGIINKMRIDGVDYDITDQSAQDSKLDKQYDAEKAGQVITVGGDGVAAPAVPTMDWGSIGGTLADQGDLSQALDNKVPMQYTGEGTTLKYLKTDNNGNVILADGSGSTVVWGDITGTLSQQTDLTTEFGKKLDKDLGSEEANKWMQTDANGIITAGDKPVVQFSEIEGDAYDNDNLNGYLQEITDDLGTKLDKSVEAEKSGYFMKVNSSGQIVPEQVSIPSGTPSFGSITGEVSENAKLMEALNGKLDTTVIDDTGAASSSKLWSSEKTNNLIASIASGVVKVEVVSALPESPVNNTMYYVGTASPYHVYLRANDTTYDMGTTSIDLTNYIKTSDVIDNLTSTATGKPLSANQGKYIATNFLKLAGGTMTGSITVPTTADDIVGVNNTGEVALCGGTSSTNGAYIKLNGKSNTSGKGFITLTATDGTNTKQAIIKPDGTFTWNGNSVITSAGGTITGTLNQKGTLNQSGALNITGDTTITGKNIQVGTNWCGLAHVQADGVIGIYGGTSGSDGANLQLGGEKNQSGSTTTITEGKWRLSAVSGDNSSMLYATPAGKLNFNGCNIVAGKPIGKSGFKISLSPIRLTPSAGPFTIDIGTGYFGHIWLMRDNRHYEGIYNYWGGLTQLRRSNFSSSELSVAISDSKLKISGTYEYQVVGYLIRYIAEDENV